MQAIRRARKWSSSIACHTIAQLIDKRLLSELTANDEMQNASQIRVEKSCVTLTYFVTTDPAFAHSVGIDVLQNSFSAISQCKGLDFTPKATHATQTLIWRAAGNVELALSGRWYALLRHPLFKNAGQTNKAKIERCDDSLCSLMLLGTKN